MRLKADVVPFGLKPEMVIAYLIVGEVYRDWGYTLTVTSGVEGKHHDFSIHYLGYALDFRTKNLKPADRKTMLKEIRIALGPCYRIHYSAKPPHFHVEFRPKGPYIK